MARSNKDIYCMMCIIALLLWAVASSVTIILLARTVTMKTITQCKMELQNETQKHLQEKSSWEKDRKSLQELLEKGRVNQTRLQRDLAVSQGQLKQSNESLMACLRDMKLLNGTKTLLQSKIVEEQEKCANDKKHLGDTLTSERKDFQQKLQEEKKKYKQECEKQKKELDSQAESVNGTSDGHKPEYCCFIYALGVAVLMIPLLF